MREVFPFSAIVGQDGMKLALLIAAVDATVGGALVFDDRGTGKSTTVRALLPCAALVTLAGLGHLAREEHPEQTAGLIAQIARSAGALA